MKYGLEDRLIKYSASVIKFCNNLDREYLQVQLSQQLIRSSISPSLMFGEAQGAESIKDYIHKTRILVKELKECRANLKIIVELQLGNPQSLSSLLSETEELIAIFSSIIITKSKLINKTK